MMSSLFYIIFVNTIIIAVTNYAFIILLITTFIFHRYPRFFLIGTNIQNFVDKCNTFFI